jgi:hypothetical protein
MSEGEPHVFEQTCLKKIYCTHAKYTRCSRKLDGQVRRSPLRYTCRMPRQPDSNAVQITQFGGMISNADPHDIPPGASVVQVNVNAVKKGELATRKGLKLITFDDEG